jgi:hypothetical protein
MLEAELVLVIDSRDMKKFFAIFFAAALLTSCMVAYEEETPQDRIGSMVSYSKQCVLNEVSMPVTRAAVCVRLDEYLEMPDGSVSSNEWLDLYGNIYKNTTGLVNVADMLYIKTDNSSIRLMGSTWTFDDGMTMTCTSSNTWVLAPKKEDDKEVSLVLTLVDAEKGLWNVEYRSFESFEDKSAVLTSDLLKATSSGKLVSGDYGQVYTWTNGRMISDVSFDGAVHVEFFCGMSVVDTVDMTWTGKTLSVKTSRD